MFFSLISRNSKRDKKNNGLYFCSMVIVIIAFYIILSLNNQDVIIFLKEMESEAVNKLISFVPAFYIASLVILYFLVYFASKMQLDRRRHELGVYLSLGMRRQKLFIMLLLEDLRTNLIAIIIGIPVGIIISELISLTTAKVVGLGIIGHRFSLSFSAILYTIIGFIIVKLSVFIILSLYFASREIKALIFDDNLEKRKPLPKILYIIILLIGVIMLIKAYQLGISGKVWNSFNNVIITLLLGIGGTIVLFYGLRLLIGAITKIGKNQKLHVFNVRQIQELVINNTTSLAICSLLLFSALGLFGAGISVASSISVASNGEKAGKHIMDYTFMSNDEESLSLSKLKKTLAKHGLESDFSKFIEVKIGNTMKEKSASFEGVIKELKKAKNSKDRETLITNLGQYDSSYLIDLSGYNEIRKAGNLKPINLKENEACLYMNSEFVINKDLVNSALNNEPKVEILGKEIKLLPQVQSLPLVTDRFITIGTGLVVNDKVFNSLVGKDYDNYISGILNKKIVEKEGLMTAIANTNKKLSHTSLMYESYIQNIGRELFFIVATSYITIYLAVIFLVVSNTIIGVSFLMGQSKVKKRYQTLIHLGATYKTLCKSSSKQINWYFFLTILIAVINSFFGVYSLFKGILTHSLRANMKEMILFSFVIIIIFAIIEVIYMIIIKKNSYKYLRTLISPKRED